MIEKSPIENFPFTTKKAWLGQRAKDITSTEISALFGLSKYMTEFELWHMKKNQDILELDDNFRMKCGRVFEPIIAQLAIEENGWSGEEFKDYCRLKDERMGSSFDFKIGTEHGVGLMEIKNVDSLIFYKEWKKDTDGNVMAPPHIELQLQWQLMITGLDYGYLVAFVGGNDLKTLYRPRNEKIIEAMRTKAKEFWKSVDENNCPAPDFEKDSGFILKLFKYSDPDKILELDGQGHIYSLASQYNEAREAEKNAKAKKDSVKAEIIMSIKDNSKILHSSFKISAGTNKKGNRLFSLTWSKG